jgi:hypothetical protein
MQHLTIRTASPNHGPLFDGATVLTADVTNLRYFAGVVNNGRTLTVTIELTDSEDGS